MSTMFENRKSVAPYGGVLCTTFGALVAHPTVAQNMATTVATSREELGTADDAISYTREFFAEKIRR